jgi:[acyl-carrier-protein] S-malonyltransferase
MQFGSTGFWMNGKMAFDTSAFSRPLIYVIPGQGDNPVGALSALYAHGGNVRTSVDETFDMIETALRRQPGGLDPPLIRQILLGNASQDAITAGVPQLAAFATAVCLYRLLEQQGYRPAAIIGLSLGEIASLVCAGVWELADGVGAVLALNAAFQPHVGQGGMIMISASETDVQALLDEIADDDLVLACVNAPRQVVVSGPHAALDALTTFTERHALALRKLPIPYPAHHPSLWRAAAHFHDAIAPLPRGAFRIPVYSAVARRRYTEHDDVPRALANSFTQPYHLPATLDSANVIPQPVYVDFSMTGIMSRNLQAARPDAEIFIPARDTRFPSSPRNRMEAER